MGREGTETNMSRPRLEVWEFLGGGKWHHHCVDGRGTRIMTGAQIAQLHGCPWCSEYPPGVEEWREEQEKERKRNGVDGE